MKQLLALILALSLTASLQAALPYLYGTTSQPGEETRFGGFEKGDFIYHTNDIVIPGRLGLDLVVGRTYH